MEDITTYKNYALSIFYSLNKPMVIIPTIGILEISNLHFAVFFLLGLLAGDFITGVFASWVEFKNEKIKGNFFSNDDKGFSSTKIRLSFVKTITYLLLILLTYAVEKVFQIKPFNSSYSSIDQITITLVAVALSCSIELYSIFFENLPRAGVSIEDKVKKIFEKIKNAVTAVKNISQ